jgi:hypothetical protein
LIGQRQHLAQPLDQKCASALVAAIFTRPAAKIGALIFGNRIKAVFALLTATEDPRGVKLAGSTAAVGFAALAAEQIERALDHGIGALERSQSLAHSTGGTPQLQAEFGDIIVQSASLILLTYTDKKRKVLENARNPWE